MPLEALEKLQEDSEEAREYQQRVEQLLGELRALSPGALLAAAC
jgi:hypothetical protein